MYCITVSEQISVNGFSKFTTVNLSPYSLNQCFPESEMGICLILFFFDAAVHNVTNWKKSWSFWIKNTDHLNKAAINTDNVHLRSPGDSLLGVSKPGLKTSVFLVSGHVAWVPLSYFVGSVCCSSLWCFFLFRILVLSFNRVLLLLLGSYFCLPYKALLR